ncbi:hypothetical protein SpAn4DRAFT_2270 [Sporomusa ovata]|uniref:Uncharacterized protein n=1 Tax=Sporomusa ovata TaxID=2378 RepID=A0A0U1L038_9FIRM|nr:hypothetical protein SpAn4DRAFT_2270 [Sporomusa ovata]
MSVSGFIPVITMLHIEITGLENFINEADKALIVNPFSKY